jgi:hypothetical protein
MAHLAKKHKKIITDVVTRWAHTLAGTRPFNLDRVRELLHTAYKHETRTVRKRVKPKKNGDPWRTTYKTIKLPAPKIFVVRSPAAFKIAEAVMRGRLSKKQAYAAAKNMDIDSSFIDGLRRDSMRAFKYTPRYSWRNSHQLLEAAWHVTLADYVTIATAVAFQREMPMRRVARRSIETRPRPGSTRKMFDKSFTTLPAYNYSQNNIQLTHNAGASNSTNMSNLYAANATSAELVALDDMPNSSAALSAVFNRVSLLDIDGRTGGGLIDAEVLIKLLGVSDLQQIWQYELMHEAARVMTFTHSVLVLDSRPTLKRNSAGERHCEDGPAVQWPDGAKMYYIDGHALGTHGKLICETPHKITLEAITAEENEEVKRLMIDKYGWPRYLADIGAVVIDRRENWVDNTVEALVELKEFRNRPGRVRILAATEPVLIKKRKLVLACRSTGRQYFLSVPEDTKTCEDGQRWMSTGAITSLVSAMKYPARLVGAS